MLINVRLKIDYCLKGCMHRLIEIDDFADQLQPWLEYWWLHLLHRCNAGGLGPQDLDGDYNFVFMP